jgi:two-component sensor histidine kinase
VLRWFADTHPEMAEPINQAVSQVQSVAVIHGLQGRKNVDTVRLCELTLAIATGVESLWRKPITVDIPSHWIPCTIAEAEAVPLALVLNELITNAVKHGDNVKISLSHEPLPDSIRVNIYNIGQFPANNNSRCDTAFDTGLQLISSLLPRSGARLSWEQNENIVITTLELDRPVIVMEPHALNAHDL